jgi:hypothetical protein
MGRILMKEYEVIEAKVGQFNKIANEKAQQDWRVVHILPGPACHRMEAEIVIFFERDIAG